MVAAMVRHLRPGSHDLHRRYSSARAQGPRTDTSQVTCYGYTTLLPGYWDVGTFFSYYTMVFLAPLLWGGWKLVKRTKMVKPEDADLVWERPLIDAYEASLVDDHVGFFTEVAQMMGFRRKHTTQDME